jgi:D-alanine-D-alanine ligase
MRQMRVAVLLADREAADPFGVSPALAGADAEAVRGLKNALETLDGYRFVYVESHEDLFDQLSAQAASIDLVLNLADKGFGNDWSREPHVPALLEILELPYSGAGPRSLAWCLDKMYVYGVAGAMAVPVPASRYVAPTGPRWDGPYPAFVKPNLADGSFGITRASVAEDAAGIARAVDAARAAFGYVGPFLVQEFLPGADLSVGLIGNPASGLTVLPILEEDYTAVDAVPHIGSYEAKWDSEDPHSPYHRLDWRRADLPARTAAEIVGWSRQLFERLECRDYARVDWRLDADGRPRLLEVNPNPGWDYWTYLATMAGWCGMSYPGMLRAIIESARTRAARDRRDGRCS